MGFYEPLHWKFPAFLGLFLLWGFLFRSTSPLVASLVCLGLVVLVVLIWFGVRRRWRS